MIDKKLLEIIACPLCKGELIYAPKQQELLCRRDKLAYPIKDQIPILLIDEARKMSDEELKN